MRLFARDRPCPELGSALVDRVKAITGRRYVDPPPMPWESRWSVFWFRVTRRFKRRRRGTPVA